MRPIPPLILSLALAVAPGSVRAHDIWLQADPYSLEPGGLLTVRQLVGEELSDDLSGQGETRELPVLRDMTPRFSLISAAGTVDLLAELPDLRERPTVQPVLERRLETAGLFLVAMDHDLLYTDHTNEEFLDYLAHEDLEAEKLTPHMAATDYQSEGYVRSLKALVRVGEADPKSGVPGRVVGQDVEIVLLDNPYALDAGAALAARVLLHGEPLAGQIVKAYVANEGRIARQQATTDAAGTARFTATERGLWLLRLVHLQPCSVRSVVECADATWESYWAAYTFELD